MGKLIIEVIIISLIQHFEADFLWKVSLKILNSGIILKTSTHVIAELKHNLALVLLNTDLSLFVNTVDQDQLVSDEATLISNLLVKICLIITELYAESKQDKNWEGA